jgi:monoamine oxidase
MMPLGGSRDGVDVLVIGAGLAGLQAARTIAAAECSVLVLEAGGEAGGRARTRRLDDGTVVDVGAEWVGPGHRRVRALAGARGIQLEPAGQLGGCVRWRLNGRIVDSHLPPVPRRELVPAVHLLRDLRATARTLDPSCPWEAGSSLDELSLAEWLERHPNCPTLHAVLRALVEPLSSTAIDELSALHPFWWLARGGVSRPCGGPPSVGGSAMERRGSPTRWPRLCLCG